jgi:hypothetical protein
MKDEFIHFSHTFPRFENRGKYEKDLPQQLPGIQKPKAGTIFSPMKIQRR